MDYKQPKQINRIATPIKLDENGNAIENLDEKKKNIKKKKKDSTNVTFIIVVLLIILAIICAILFYLIIPLVNQESNTFHYNDSTTEFTTSTFYNISDTYINDLGYVNTEGTYNINEDFIISLVNSNGGFNILVNDSYVATADYLLSKVGFVDDLIIIITQDSNARTTRLIAITKDGEEVYELYNISDVQGLVLNSDNSSIIFNSASIVINTTRVLSSSLILDETFGSVSGINICSEEELSNNSLSGNSVALANYSIEYLGNHEFSKPKSIYNITIDDYINTNNLCQ